ncbi:MAG: hypothetical protein FWC09_04845 [Lachnospiraceae bacterium]|nr:hypothetical protein [Lachnospiraceae bacterium]
MVDPKIIFVKRFLAEILDQGYKSIPINDERFMGGLDSMADYFQNHINQFGKSASKLEFLFLKYNTRGEYRQFTKIIEGFNGRIVSLDNPRYINANIKLDKEYVDKLINGDELDINKNDFEQIVNCFISGAKLSKHKK